MLNFTRTIKRSCMNLKRLLKASLGALLFASSMMTQAQCLQTAPYTETFDSLVIPNCWVDTATTGDGWQFSGNPDYDAASAGDHTGNGGLFAWVDFSGTDLFTVLEMPAVDVTSLTTPALFFSMFSSNSLSPDLNIMYIEVDPGTGWTAVDSIQQDLGGWADFIYDLSTYVNANQLKVRFRAESGGGGADYNNDLLIDDVSIDAYPTCLKPTNLYDFFVGKDSAVFTWTSASGGSNFEIDFGLAGFTQGTNTSFISVSDDTASLNNLLPGTAYDVYVREDCGTSNGLSRWTGPLRFTTAYVPPYLEDFVNVYPNDGYTEGKGQITDSTTFTSTSSFWGSSASTNVGGGEKAYLNLYSTGRFEWFFTPTIDLGTGTAYQLEFDVMLTAYASASSATLGTDDTLRVVISTDNGITWSKANTLLTLTSTSNILNGAGTHYVVSLAAYSGPIQVGFYAESTLSNADNDIYIDNIQIRIPPSCPDPSGLVSTWIGRDSIQVAWDSVYNAFNLEYGPSGFTPGIGQGTVIAVTDTFAGVGGLSANTPYDFYVTTDCSGAGNGFSVTTGPITVNTLCNALPVPFTETFNSTSLTQSCWTVLDVNGDGDAWDLDYPSNPLNGDEVAVIYTDFNGGVNDDWLISPALSFTGNEQLAYYYRVQSSFEPNDFQVLVSTTGTNPADFTDTIVPFASYGNETYIRETVDMSAYTSDIYIAWHVPPGGLDGWRLYIDSVVVEALPPCPDPSQLTAGNITAFQADLSWTNPNATLWNIEVLPAGFGQGSGTTASTSNNPYTATNLSPNTCYDYYVQQDCGSNGTSQWIGPFTFCTPPTCPAPTNLGVDPTSITLNAADIYWTTGGATNWNVEYGAAGFSLGAGFGIQSTNDTLSLSNLASGTEYEFHVRDSCSATDTSFWTGPFSFITAFNTNYLEDFNAGIAPPFAWEEADGILMANTVLSGTSSDWGSANFGNSSGTTQAMKVNIWTTNQSEWLITPSLYLDPSIPNLQAEFDVAVTAYNDSIQGYLDPDDSLAFVISTDNGNTWSNANILWAATDQDTIDATGERITLPLAAYSGYVRFGFYGKSATSGSADNDFHIDHFEVRTPRVCNTPVLDSVVAITTTSATVHWTDGEINASSWDLILTTSGQSPGQGVVTTLSSSGSYSYSNLTDATTYCIYLVETCANGISDTAGPLCFNTLCNPFVAPYSEDFEGGSASCWSNEFDTGTQEWTINTGSSGGVVTSAHSGNLNARFTSSFAGPHITKFVSPLIDASALSTTQLSFWYAQEEWFGDQNYLNVYYRTSTSSPWILVWGDSSNVTAWKGDTVTIPSNSSTLQVAFEGVDLYGRANVVDDVLISEPTSCPQPLNLDTIAVGCDQATLSWNSSSSATDTEVEIMPSGGPIGSGTRTAGAASPYPMGNLNVATAYDFYVRDICAPGDTSNWAGPFTFTTDTTPAITADFSFVQTTTTANNATVDFDASASVGATSYLWDFGNGNGGIGVNATTTYSANQVYNVKLIVGGPCGARDSLTQAVTVTGISLEENRFNATISLYPNPSKGVFYLNVGNTSKLYGVEITDLSGRVVFRAAELEPRMDHMIQLSDEAAGMYLLKIKGEGLRMNQRIILDK